MRQTWRVKGNDVDQLLETFKNMGPGRLALMGATFFGLVIFFLFIVGKSSAPNMTLLYGELSSRDATEISTKLDAVNVPYELRNNGTEVAVNQKDVSRARMLLAEEGLPRKGSIGYEIFDQKQSFGTTSFQQNISKVRAMEGELARTISTIDNIRDARVHLVLPERELFSREANAATASVFLNIQNEAALTKDNIEAIQHLVAAAVPQLKPVNVAIIDQNGTLLARGEEEDRPGSVRGADEAKDKYETRLTRSIDEMVGRIVGFGKVRTTVNADLNFDITTRNSEKYDPDGQVVRSTQAINDESVDTTGANNANVTVQNNLPGLPADGSAAGAAGSRNNRTEEVTNYEISKTVENVVSESGDVKRLSIAVLVDGRYQPDTSVKKPDDAAADWQPPRIYTPRSQEELDKIATLVKSAVGYDESRGDAVEVVNMQFAETDFFTPPADNRIMGFERSEIIDIAETLALSVVAVLIILLVLRPLATHFTQTAAAAAAEANALSPQGEAALMLGQNPAQAQLAGPGGMALPGSSEVSELDAMLDMGAVEGRVRASSVQKITELVTNHPTETISVIRQWMSQEN